jgi:hypothetical protein
MTHSTAGSRQGGEAARMVGEVAQDRSGAGEWSGWGDLIYPPCWLRLRNGVPPGPFLHNGDCASVMFS